MKTSMHAAMMVVTVLDIGVVMGFSGFYLVNPQTGSDEHPLIDGDSLNGLVAIRAEFEISGIESVKFFINGLQETVENVTPWTLFGDTPEEGYASDILPSGNTTLKAIAYAEPGGRGDAVEEIDITLKVADVVDDDDGNCIDDNKICGFGIGTACCGAGFACFQKNDERAKCKRVCIDGWDCTVLIDDNVKPPRVAYDFTADLLVLHYDNAPDRDDVMSAALDRTVLDGLGTNKVCGNNASTRLLAVQGTYGRCDTCNVKTYLSESEEPMRTILTGCTDEDGEAYVDAHDNWDAAVGAAKTKWIATLAAGNKVFVKEGGQADFTADVLRAVKNELNVDTKKTVIVVQHSVWNENMSTKADLDYVKKNAAYIKIADANKELQVCGDTKENEDFIAAFKEIATKRPGGVGVAWTAALEYYKGYQFRGHSCPYNSPILDSSDTGELFYILGLGKMDFSDVMEDYFGVVV